MSSGPPGRLSGMTIIAPTTRPTTAGHAYVVPVVREIAPPQSCAASDGW